MKSSRTTRLLAAGAIFAFGAATPVCGQVIVPAGFTVQTINFSQELTGLAVGDGGAFGSAVYAAVPGAVLKIDPGTGAFTSFATGLATGAGSPSGLAFGNGAFGSDLYVAQNAGSVARITSTGSVTTFTSGGTLFSSNNLAFAPSGSAYGNRLFVSNGGGTGGTMSVVNSDGTNAAFSPNSQFNGSTPSGVAFAPKGSAFGGSLYVTVLNGRIAQLDTAGNATNTVTSGLGVPVDLAFGSKGFGDNLYVTDINTQHLLRVTPTGTVSAFATGFKFTTVAFDADIRFSPDGNVLYIANNNQLVIIRPSPVPTPGALAVALGGFVPGVCLLFRRRQRNRQAHGL